MITATDSIKEQWKAFRIQLTETLDGTLAPVLSVITKTMGWLFSGSMTANVTKWVMLATLGFSIFAKVGIGLAAQIGGLVGDVKKVGPKVLDAGKAVAGFGVRAGKGIATAFATGGKSVASFASSAASLMGKGMASVGKSLLSAGAASWKFVASLIAQAAAWALTPFGMITIAIVAIVAGITLLWKKCEWFREGIKKLGNFIKGMIVPMLIIMFPLIGFVVLLIKNWRRVLDFFKNFSLKEAGAKLIGGLISGILEKFTSPIKLVKGLVGKIRNLFPFSPAKEGPLRDIHKIRMVETIADSMNEKPLLGKVASIAGRARKALGSGLSLAARGAAAIAVPALGAMSGRAAAPIAITINIHAPGAGPGAAQDIHKAIMAAVPQIHRAITAAQDKAARASNTGAVR
jgi:hypothetical protein